MALSFTLINTRNQSIGNRIRDGVAFGNRAVFWAKNPATVATILRHTSDGVTVLDTADIDTVNSDNPQRVPQMALRTIDDGFLYVIADPGSDAGLQVERTSDLITFAPYLGTWSVRATQYGALGAIQDIVGLFLSGMRTEVLAAPVENPRVLIDDGIGWTPSVDAPGSGAITAFDSPVFPSSGEQIAFGRSTELYSYNPISNLFTIRHTALATIHRLKYWPALDVLIYARFWQGAEPANTSRIYSAPFAGGAWAFTERYAGQITGIVSDFILVGNDLYFATIDGQPTGANLRIYKASSLTSAPSLEATIVPANPALDSSAFLVYHAGMNKIFVTLQTLAGPARQEIYAASLGAGSKQKRLRLSH